jgi:hypothetical protein
MEDDKIHYLAKSVRERKLFKQYYKGSNQFNHKFTPYDGKEKYDVTYSIIDESFKIHNVIAEIKVREKSYKEINGGYYIQKDKYDYIMSQKFDIKQYICIFEDGILVWDLNKIKQPEFKIEELRANNINNKTKEKEVGYLYFWDAEVINIKINVFESLKESYKITKRLEKIKLNKLK